jgi:hypothetical protein
LTVVALLLVTAPLVAQDAPIGPEGTLVATQATPAAAENADALRKAAQNPVASLISVPVQNNNNFGIDPSYQLYHALKDNGVPVKFVAYPVPGHFPDDSVRYQEVYHRWLHGLDQYLTYRRNTNTFSKASGPTDGKERALRENLD